MLVRNILALVVRDYEANRRSSLPLIRARIRKHLIPFFGDRDAATVRTSDITDYKQKRKVGGAAVATVWVELAILRRAYNLALDDELLERKPKITTPASQCADPRTGHYTHDEFLRLAAAGDTLLSDIVTVAYYSGWRKNEILGLHRDMVRLEERIVVLPKSHHKNRHPKVLAPDGALWDIIVRRYLAAGPNGYLFHRGGKRVKSILRAYMTACRKAGLCGKLFHDLRRSARINLRRAGVDLETSKATLGHMSTEVHNAYNSVSIDELREAQRRVVALHEAATPPGIWRRYLNQLSAWSTGIF